MRQLASGRWQARYLDAAGMRHTAPRTFPTKVEATRYLAQVEADLLRGNWADLHRAGEVTPTTIEGIPAAAPHPQRGSGGRRPAAKSARGEERRDRAGG